MNEVNERAVSVRWELFWRCMRVRGRGGQDREGEDREGEGKAREEVPEDWKAEMRMGMEAYGSRLRLAVGR